MQKYLPGPGKSSESTMDDCNNACGQECAHFRVHLGDGAEITPGNLNVLTMRLGENFLSSANRNIMLFV